MKAGIIGAGRIGKVHAKNIVQLVPELEIKMMADPFANDQTRAFADTYNIPHVVKDATEILNDDEIETVLICSSTDTHSKYIIESAKAGKHIFCEKPIDYDIQKAREAIKAAESANVKLFIGFSRRFDHNHKAVHDIVADGKIGAAHIIKISSRDPEPPPISYVKVSGGIFYDMMIHDFDMARFLAGSEPVEVHTQGSVLVDPAIGQAGDVDTAVATVKFESGAIAVIDNSRKAVYGYDQRVEVFGEKGMAANSNDLPSTAYFSNAEGTVYQACYKIMWDRYTQAFVDEMKSFAKCVLENTEPSVSGMDGLYAVLMAAAAKKSLKAGRPVKLSEVV
jgi:myo-inositol 2-dehydrogenase/D-chiro-inositol 1-dehydrogenase